MGDVQIPKLTRWQIEIPTSVSQEEATEVSKNAVLFLVNPNKDGFVPNVSIVLSGVVYGRKDFADGTIIITSMIQRIELVDEVLGEDDTVPLFEALTWSGSRYRFRRDDCNSVQTALMCWIIEENPEIREQLNGWTPESG